MVAKVPRSKAQKASLQRHEYELEGGVAGALAGATMGGLAGPPGAIAGAAIGGAVGAVAAAALEKHAADEAAEAELLDAEPVASAAPPAPAAGPAPRMTATLPSGARRA